MKVLFKSGDVVFTADFNDCPAAREIIQGLPIESVVSRWGDEVYFDIGFKVSAQDATMDIIAGDVAYWSQGKALCIFFGPTPASNADKPVPASPVVVVGRTTADPAQLRSIPLGQDIRVWCPGA